MKPWLKRRKNLEFYVTLLAELRLEEEYNYNILLPITSENFEEIFQLTKGDIPKENYNLQPHLAFYQQGSYKRMMVMSIVFPTQL